MAGTIAGVVESFIPSAAGGIDGYRLLQLFSAAIMAGAGFYVAGWLPHFAYIEKVGIHFWRRIKPFGRRLIPVKDHTQAFLFGMIWGWLPCGLVYTALALALSTGDVAKSTLTMLFFGLGTLPAVMGVGIMTSVLTRLSKMQRFKQSVGLLMIALALLAAMPWLNPMAIITTNSLHNH